MAVVVVVVVVVVIATKSFYRPASQTPTHNTNHTSPAQHASPQASQPACAFVLTHGKLSFSTSAVLSDAGFFDGPSKLRQLGFLQHPLPHHLSLLPHPLLAQPPRIFESP